MPKVSVIVPARNATRTIVRCLRSITDGVEKDIEIIVVDDASDDDTATLVHNFPDDRITLLSLPAQAGAAAARNAGLKRAKSELVFFLDADCVADRQWITSGCRSFDDPSIVGVEGSIHYEIASPTFRHRVPVNPFYNFDEVRPINAEGRDYAAANVAYRRSVLAQIGGFDARNFPSGREDTDLGLRARRRGLVRFCAAMQVVHLEDNWTASSLWRSARRYEADVRLLARNGDFPFRFGPLLHPQLLALLLFPPMIPIRYRRQLRTFRDVTFLPAFFVYLVLVRFHLWRAALAHRTLAL